MSFTPTEDRRVTAIEEKLNAVQIALNKLATKQQMKQLLNVRRAEIDTLQTDVLALEQRVFDLENP